MGSKRFCWVVEGVVRGVGTSAEAARVRAGTETGRAVRLSRHAYQTARDMVGERLENIITEAHRRSTMQTVKTVPDPIHEGIALACEGVGDLMREEQIDKRAALARALAEFDTWAFSAYGPQAEAVREACSSHLSSWLRELDAEVRHDG